MTEIILPDSEVTGVIYVFSVHHRECIYADFDPPLTFQEFDNLVRKAEPYCAAKNENEYKHHVIPSSAILVVAVFDGQDAQDAIDDFYENSVELLI